LTEMPRERSHPAHGLARQLGSPGQIPSASDSDRSPATTPLASQLKTVGRCCSSRRRGLEALGHD
jgi:hypothetical protein